MWLYIFNPLLWILFYFIAYSWFIIVYACPRFRNKLFRRNNPFKSIFTGVISVLVFLGIPTIITIIKQPSLLEYYRIMNILGLIIIIIAIYIEIISRSQIGIFPGLKKKEKLIKGGIYQIIRHPIYLGNSLLVVGLAVFFNSKISFIFSIFYFISYIPLIFLEEKILLKEYNKEYESYKKNTPNILIPKLI